MKFDCASASLTGPRSANEDTVGVWQLENGVAIAVADGLGGLRGGQTASKFAIARFGQALVEDSPDMQRIVERIHEDIKVQQREQDELRGMATTLTAAWMRSGVLRFVHCGDTRLALQRGNGIIRLTEDHSEARRLYNAGALTKEELATYPRKNVLESALGSPGTLRVDTGTVQLEVGDRIMITSDGVHTKVLLREMKKISDSASSAVQFIEDMITEVNKRKPDDNFSIATAFATHDDL